MNLEYSNVKISESEAQKVAVELFDVQGAITPLPGESDFNFRIKTESVSYLLKISRPDEDPSFIDFQYELLNHLTQYDSIESPKLYPNKEGEFISKTLDSKGVKRIVRLLSWVNGRLWSSVNPISDKLIYSLGAKTGELTKALTTFEHDFAIREYEWDITQALWCKDHLDLFEPKRAAILDVFLNRFESIQEEYQTFRKSVIHSDVNDNNILVESDLRSPSVKSIIDFGDAVFAASINDAAIALAYVVMHKNDPLAAATEFIKGCHAYFPLREEELDVLHTLVAMRLTITVTKSAMNKIAEPENKYHQISEKPAWDVLEKWIEIDQKYAAFCFRNACGFSIHEKKERILHNVSKANYTLKGLFPTLKFNEVYSMDMSVGSQFLGHEFEFQDLELTSFKLARLRKEQPNSILAGGYSEVRPIYTSNAYRKEGNNGPEDRACHLGVDFWVDAGTEIHAFEKAVVYSIYDNNIHKDYGPTVILEHTTSDGDVYYSLYGHLARKGLNLFQKGEEIAKGDLIGYAGDSSENGNWAPHLHFQLMMDLLGYAHNYPGVAYPNELNVWQQICPDPAFFFKELDQTDSKMSKEEIVDYRSRHLGKGLSLSYDAPLQMVRGAGAYLMDNTGRKYLDTVNNVAHVGHEHPRVVKAGQQQMALLNTNTRYVHPNITDFAKELLDTFPEELSVVHFVNSGSEANELALRMAQTVTNQKDMIAVEIGYHGNTSGCVNVSSYKFDGKGGNGAPEHTHIVPLPDRFRGIYSESEAHRYAEHVEEQVGKIKAKGRNVAGFICESIISCGGQIELPENYLKTAYEAVRKEGGVCISDEVQVGLGRVGEVFWGFQLHGVIPDIVTIGKPLGNGHPLAAVVCTKAIAEAFANGMEYFNTFGGNPVSCAIGTEVLRIVKEEKLQDKAREVGNYLKDQLKELQSAFPLIQDIRGKGLFLGFELVDEKKKPLPAKATYLTNRMKDLGVLMSTDGKDHNAIKIKPPIIFSIENADELLNRMKMVLKEDFMR